MPLQGVVDEEPDQDIRGRRRRASTGGFIALPGSKLRRVSGTHRCQGRCAIAHRLSVRCGGFPSTHLAQNLNYNRRRATPANDAQTLRRTRKGKRQERQTQPRRQRGDGTPCTCSQGGSQEGAQRAERRTKAQAQGEPMRPTRGKDTPLFTLSVTQLQRPGEAGPERVQWRGVRHHRRLGWGVAALRLSPLLLHMCSHVLWCGSPPGHSSSFDSPPLVPFLAPSFAPSHILAACPLGASLVGFECSPVSLGGRDGKRSRSSPPPNSGVILHASYGGATSQASQGGGLTGVLAVAAVATVASVAVASVVSRQEREL